ncbi:MAG: TlpA family protein disulfide reductase [Chitinophagaceae bacterium]
MILKTWLLHVVVCFSSLTAFSQVDTLQPPFKRFPTLPPIQLLLRDSTTKYTKADIPKKKPVLLILFSPDCSHCQQTAEELMKYREQTKNFHVVMSTLHPIWQMNEFVTRYKINELENVVVGKDIYYLMPSFYSIKNLPFMAFYNKKGNLISVFEGAMSIEKAIKQFE